MQRSTIIWIVLCSLFASITIAQQFSNVTEFSSNQTGFSRNESAGSTNVTFSVPNRPSRPGTNPSQSVPLITVVPPAVIEQAPAENATQIEVNASQPAGGNMSQPVEGNVSQPAEGNASPPSGEGNQSGTVIGITPAENATQIELNASQPAEVNVSQPSGEGNQSGTVIGITPAENATQIELNASQPAEGNASQPAEGNASQPAGEGSQSGTVIGITPAENATQIELNASQPAEGGNQSGTVIGITPTENATQIEVNTSKPAEGGNQSGTVIEITPAENATQGSTETPAHVVDEKGGWLYLNVTYKPYIILNNGTVYDRNGSEVPNAQFIVRNETLLVNNKSVSWVSEHDLRIAQNVSFIWLDNGTFLYTNGTNYRYILLNNGKLVDLNGHPVKNAIVARDDHGRRVVWVNCRKVRFESEADIIEHQPHAPVKITVVPPKQGNLRQHH